MLFKNSLHIGLFNALIAFLLWGLVPIYFKALTQVSEFEVLSHRIIWSVVFLCFYLHIKRLWPYLRSLTWLQLKPFIFSSILVSSNWFVFIWAVGQNNILETSLGYFINPLVSVCLGMVFLGERLRAWQIVAVSLAFVGVLNQLIYVGKLPWIAIILAMSFAGYGLIRKVYPINALVGLFIETVIMLPFALSFLGWLYFQGGLSFLQLSLRMDLLLVLAGLVTSVPLLFFAIATKKLSLKVMGMVQYLTPSLSFLIAIFLYDEPFKQAQLITFLLIWLGLVIFAVEGFKQGIKNARQN